MPSAPCALPCATWLSRLRPPLRVPTLNLALAAGKTAMVMERKDEVQRGKLVIEKTQEARADYFRRMQQELAISKS